MSLHGLRPLRQLSQSHLTAGGARLFPFGLQALPQADLRKPGTQPFRPISTGTSGKEGREGRVAGAWATMNHYQVLGLSPGAGPKEIKASYYRLSMKYHPDRQTESLVTGGDAHSIFTRINEAYSVLSDAVKRKDYDAHLGLHDPHHPRQHHQPLHQQHPQHHHHRQPSGFARGSPYAYYTARTSYFNFREHYDAHYGRIFKPTRVSSEEREILTTKNFKMLQVFGLVLAIFASASLLSPFLRGL